MNNINFYWSVYKNIEKEVLVLANEIHFCDTQLNVYSVKIADLIFRISAEIESIIKDLYRREKNEEPDSPGSALIFLDQFWNLKTKIVFVSAANMYFHEDENKIFAPFNYSKYDDNDYFSKYNAIKHDRVKNISKANIRTLIRSLGSLYLLNIYYKEERFELKNDTTRFPVGLGSDIFSIKPHRSNYATKTGYEINPDFDECVYLIVYTDKYFNEYIKILTDVANNVNKALFTHPKVIQYISENIESIKTLDVSLVNNILDPKEYLNVLTTGTRTTPNIKNLMDNVEYEAVLNRGKVHQL